MQSETFTSVGEMITFDGFLKVYRESTDDDDANADEQSHVFACNS